MSTLTSYTHYINWSSTQASDVQEAQANHAVSVAPLAADTMTFIKSAAVRSKSYVTAVTDALNDVCDARVPQC